MRNSRTAGCRLPYSATSSWYCSYQTHANSPMSCHSMSSRSPMPWRFAARYLHQDASAAICPCGPCCMPVKALIIITSRTCSRRERRSAASGDADGKSRCSAGASPHGSASSIVAAKGDAIASTSCCDGCPATNSTLPDQDKKLMHTQHPYAFLVCLAQALGIGCTCRALSNA